MRTFQSWEWELFKGTAIVTGTVCAGVFLYKSFRKVVEESSPAQCDQANCTQVDSLEIEE